MTVTKIIQSLAIGAIALVGFHSLVSAEGVPHKINVNQDSMRINSYVIQSLTTIDNASQRFFREGNLQLEQEITNLLQGKYELDESILSVDSEITDSLEEIQQYDQPKIDLN